MSWMFWILFGLTALAFIAVVGYIAYQNRVLIGAWYAAHQAAVIRASGLVLGVIVLLVALANAFWWVVFAAALAALSWALITHWATIGPFLGANWQRIVVPIAIVGVMFWVYLNWRWYLTPSQLFYGLVALAACAAIAVWWTGAMTVASASWRWALGLVALVLVVLFILRISPSVVSYGYRAVQDAGAAIGSVGSYRPPVFVNGGQRVVQTGNQPVLTLLSDSQRVIENPPSARDQAQIEECLDRWEGAPHNLDRNSRKAREHCGLEP